MSALGFKARMDPFCLCASSPVCNRFLRFTSGVPPVGSQYDSQGISNPCTCVQALVGLESGIERAAASQRVTTHRKLNFGKVVTSLSTIFFSDRYHHTSNARHNESHF